MVYGRRVVRSFYYIFLLVIFSQSALISSPSPTQMRSFSLLLLLSLVSFVKGGSKDSVWAELKEKAPMVFQMLKEKVTDTVGEWTDREENYSNKESTSEMLCEFDEDDKKVHRILKKLEKEDDKFEKLVKKIKKFFKSRKESIVCTKAHSEGDECLCEEDSNEAFCFLESVKDSYEKVKGKLECNGSTTMTYSITMAVIILALINN
ncbi:hypothetical protein PFISCL1PPCAC_676 [Pristionchus fissidentatus]|uniref:Uncharacterized protein n=1 Tax=Pristionchus fissidentatus TaxID=1538716 RepID=A0AAV5UQJ3_9BILA|nr:hypothetical protein PFISCL1PPCAC_676 [Pristionchus fissidentatus]